MGSDARRPLLRRNSAHRASPLIGVLALLASPALALPTTEAQRKPEDLGVLFVGGFQTTRANYEGYLARFSETFAHVGYQDISSDMFNPDHMRDHDNVKAALKNLQDAGARRVIAIGFSSGGKHAARLALDDDHVVALGLLDPVDGGPDPEGKTPIFIKDGDEISKPTMLLASEHGPKPKVAGRACAPRDVGPDHFRAHIAPEKLIVNKTVSGASHLNFVAKPWNFMFRVACDNGTNEHEATLSAITNDVVAFLEGIQ